MDIQKSSESLEKVLERDLKESFLKATEFLAINEVLLHLQIKGEYIPKEVK